jgi:hypothetical protein
MEVTKRPPGREDHSFSCAYHRHLHFTCIALGVGQCLRLSNQALQKVEDATGLSRGVSRWTLLSDLLSAADATALGRGDSRFQLQPRVDAHYEVRLARCAFEPARASHDVEDSLIDSRNWIRGSVNLNIKLISVGSNNDCLSVGL